MLTSAQRNKVRQLAEDCVELEAVYLLSEGQELEELILSPLIAGTLIGALSGAGAGVGGSLAGHYAARGVARAYHGARMRNDPHIHAARLMQSLDPAEIIAIDKTGKALSKHGMGTERGAMAGAVRGGFLGHQIGATAEKAGAALGNPAVINPLHPLRGVLQRVSDLKDTQKEFTVLEPQLYQGMGMAAGLGAISGAASGIRVAKLKALERLKKKNPQAFKKALKLAGLSENTIPSWGHRKSAEWREGTPEMQHAAIRAEDPNASSHELEQIVRKAIEWENVEDDEGSANFFGWQILLAVATNPNLDPHGEAYHHIANSVHSGALLQNPSATSWDVENPTSYRDAPRRSHSQVFTTLNLHRPGGLGEDIARLTQDPSTRRQFLRLLDDHFQEDTSWHQASLAELVAYAYAEGLIDEGFFKKAGERLKKGIAALGTAAVIAGAAHGGEVHKPVRTPTSQVQKAEGPISRAQQTLTSLPKKIQGAVTAKDKEVRAQHAKEKPGKVNYPDADRESRIMAGSRATDAKRAIHLDNEKAKMAQAQAAYNAKRRGHKYNPKDKTWRDESGKVSATGPLQK